VDTAQSPTEMEPIKGDFLDNKLSLTKDWNGLHSRQIPNAIKRLW